MLQNKLINKKNSISTKNDIQRIQMSHPYKSFTHWDSLLRKYRCIIVNYNIIYIVQTKYLALDFYEERKWKKACGYILAQNAKKENEKKYKNDKINSLYNKCYSLYIAINQYYNISEQLVYNNNDRLNNYLHTNINNNVKNMIKDILYWVKYIKEIETEIKSCINVDMINNNKLCDVFSSVKNIINIQKQKIKKIIDNLQHIDLEILNDYNNLLKQSYDVNPKENKNYILIENNSEINYNEININLKVIKKQIDEEINQDMLKVEKINISKSNRTKENNFSNNNISKSLIKSNIGNERKKISSSFLYNSSNKGSPQKIFLSTKEKVKVYDENINDGINPTNLVLEVSNGITHRNIDDYFKNNANIGNCFSMPIFDFNKLMNTTYNLNNLEFDKKNIYFKFFPAIENDEKKLIYKKLINGLEAENNNNTKNNNINYEQTTRCINLTPLQKLTILYGIFTTGNNPYLVNFILNVYFPTRCIIYNIDEINYITKKMADEIGIDYESNFVNTKHEIFNFDKRNSHYLGSTQTSGIASVFNMYEYSEFEYNKTIQIIMNKHKKNYNNMIGYIKTLINYKNSAKQKNNNLFNINNKRISVQKSILLTNVITHNPYIINKHIKKIFLKKVINYLKELCKTIIELKKNNRSKFNYFTGTSIKDNQGQINDINYKEIIKNKNKYLNLNKNNILKSLKAHRNEFKTYSIKKYQDEIHKKNKQNNNMEKTKINILHITNKYSEYNIKKEWNSMKDNWCQNNSRLNPIFKLNNDINTDLKKNNNYNNDYRLNKYNTYEKEEKIEFEPILNLKINQ